MSKRSVAVLVLSSFLFAIPVLADAKFRRAGKPLRHSYLVVLQQDTGGNRVREMAFGLAHAHGGRVSAVLTDAIKAFGFRGSEEAAIALSHNPNVAWVEEDGYVDLAGAERPSKIETQATSWCRLQGTYMICSYGPVISGQITRCTPQTPTWQCDDEFSHVDRIDNRAPISPANRAYAWTTNGFGVRAYVVDTGIRGTHHKRLLYINYAE